MKAWVLHDINKLKLETREKPVPAPGEVLVKVKAAGICGSDIPRIYKTGAHIHPLIPGHEFAGIVEETGPGADPDWRGRRVGIFPLIPCGSCPPCRKKRYEMCRNYNYLGSRRDGGFAEYTAVPQECLIALPEEVSFAAAAMLEPMAVAAHAMRRVMPEPWCTENADQSKKTLHPTGAKTEQPIAMSDMADESKLPDDLVHAPVFAVCGLGTIGLLLTMLLLERQKAQREESNTRAPASPRLLVIGNKDFQKQKVLELGLPSEAYCDSRSQDVSRWLMEQTGNQGPDVFFECVGKNETLQLAVDNTAPGGRICLVGNPYSDMLLEKSIYWKILRNQLTITGTWNSSFTHSPEDDWSYVLERLFRKTIAPEQLISHRLSLEELEHGLHVMRDKAEDYVKVMAFL